MMLFQFLLIAAVVIAAALAVRFLPGERSLALKRIYAMLFVIVAVLAIIFPNTLTAVANFFGIGRGTDLLLYLFIVAVLVFAVATVRAKARSDARVTDLARAVALMEARLLERDEAGTGAGGAGAGLARGASAGGATAASAPDPSTGAASASDCATDGSSAQ